MSKGQNSYDGLQYFSVPACEQFHEKTVFLPIQKTKAQISCAVTAQLIIAFVFTTWIVQYLFFLNTKLPASSLFCDCTGQFVSELVGNTEDWFSRVAANVINSKTLSVLMRTVVKLSTCKIFLRPHWSSRHKTVFSSEIIVLK